MAIKSLSTVDSSAPLEAVQDRRVVKPVPKSTAARASSTLAQVTARAARADASRTASAVLPSISRSIAQRHQAAEFDHFLSGRLAESPSGPNRTSPDSGPDEALTTALTEYLSTSAGQAFASLHGVSLEPDHAPTLTAFTWFERSMADEYGQATEARSAVRIGVTDQGEWFVFDRALPSGSRLALGVERDGRVQASGVDPHAIVLSVSGSPSNGPQLETGHPASASREELLAIDLVLADPVNAALVDRLGPSTVLVSSALSFSLVERFGEQRFAQMQLLQRAHEDLRERFARAYGQARLNEPDLAGLAETTGGPLNSGGGRSSGPDPVPGAPGWRVQWHSDWVDAGEQGYVLRERRATAFDPLGFVQWYASQHGLDHSAFAALYAVGARLSPVDSASPRMDEVPIPDRTLQLANGLWTLNTENAYMAAAAGLMPVHAEQSRLVDPKAVGFDALLGIATTNANLKNETDSWDTAFDVVATVAIAYLAVQTGGTAAAALELGSGTVAAGLVSGAVAGGVGAVMNGALSGHLGWDSFLRSVLSGALGGALGGAIGQLPLDTSGTTTLASLGLPTAGGETQWGLRVASALGQSTLRGLLTDALGGEFNDGFRQALLQFVAAELGRGIDRFAFSQPLSEPETTAVRSFANIATSALRVAGTPGHGLQAVARDWLVGLLGDALAATSGSTNSTSVAKPPAGPAAGTVAETPLVATNADNADNADNAIVAPEFQVPLLSSEPILLAANGGHLANQAAVIRRETVTDIAVHSDSEGGETRSASATLETPATAGPTFFQADLRRLPDPLDNASTLPNSRYIGPRLEDDTGFPMFVEAPVRPGIDPAASRRIGALIESGYNELIAHGQRVDLDPSLPEQDLVAVETLRAANAIRLQRAELAGATEDNGFVFDTHGNVRVFNLTRENVITTGVDESVRTAYSYRTPDGQVVYMQNRSDVPAEITNVVTVRELYYKDKLNGRDYSVPDEYRAAIDAARTDNGDPVDSIRRFVSVPQTGPLAELNRFIDPGTGQINPLQMREFEAVAAQIAEQLKRPLQVVVTTNGMMNTYQQARSNGSLLAASIENSIVIGVLNPTTDSNLFDGLESLRGRLGTQQTVSTALTVAIGDAVELQQKLIASAESGGTRSPPTVRTDTRVLVIGHSQGTVNLSSALNSDELDDVRSEVRAAYIGTAVDSVPRGLNELVNITDRSDPVSTRLTAGARAVTNTFRRWEPLPGGETLPGQSTELDTHQTGRSGTRTIDPEAQGTLVPIPEVPDNYRSVVTDFRQASESPRLPTGNFHSLGLYLPRRAVQQALRDLMPNTSVNVLPPRLPLFTESTSAPAGT